jgi:hypothetical protein
MNFRVHSFLCSGVSQRRTAKLLRLNVKTVVSKFLFLSHQVKNKHEAYLKLLAQKSEEEKIQAVQFDEMESHEKSKCLPVSIPLVVEEKTRKILGFRVCSMPAKGPLAAISLKKYGRREDERAQAVDSLFTELKPILSKQGTISSDLNPKYPNWIRPHFPQMTHQAFKGKRGCIAGQGELKKIGFDPLFSFNHTAAMLRANINRLFRKTWCFSKKKERLASHIFLYLEYHNRVLT